MTVPHTPAVEAWNARHLADLDREPTKVEEGRRPCAPWCYVASDEAAGTTPHEVAARPDDRSCTSELINVELRRGFGRRVMSTGDRHAIAMPSISVGLERHDNAVEPSILISALTFDAAGDSRCQRFPGLLPREVRELVDVLQLALRVHEESAMPAGSEPAGPSR